MCFVLYRSKYIKSLFLNDGIFKMIICIFRNAPLHLKRKIKLFLSKATKASNLVRFSTPAF